MKATMKRAQLLTNILLDTIGLVLPLVLAVLDSLGFIEVNTSILIALIAIVIIYQIQFIRRSLDNRFDYLSSQIEQGNPATFLKLTDQRQATIELTEKAMFEILIIGNHLQNFLSTESHTIIRGLERGVKVKILLLDPLDENLLKYTSFTISRGQVEKVRQDILFSLEQLSRIERLVNKNSGSLEVRVSNSVLTTTGLLVDEDQILVNLVPPNSSSILRSTYFIINRRVSKDIFEMFSRSFRSLWEDAKIYDYSSTSTKNYLVGRDE